MTTLITAATVLSQNGYSIISGSTGDFTTSDTEAMINSGFNLINLLAGTSITKLSGSPGSSTIEDDEEPAFNLLMTIMLREAKKTSLSNATSTGGSSGTAKSVAAMGFSKSESSSVSSAISASTAINNSANSPLVDFFNQAIERLRALHPNTQISSFRLRFGVGQATS